MKEIFSVVAGDPLAGQIIDLMAPLVGARHQDQGRVFVGHDLFQRIHEKEKSHHKFRI
jgi:hypothetical protein